MAHESSSYDLRRIDFVIERPSRSVTIKVLISARAFLETARAIELRSVLRHRHHQPPEQASHAMDARDSPYQSLFGPI
jgi:hypothetical protein